uniref:RuBisCO large subunit-binding protein subunit alpha, chloroplastic-like n=1 Tax=Elaeis guineensis var. tenera TaxID=51953 RepID=A0A6I9R112_ELAGV|nr:ruBisCO large subunit-binding protein subunit alpha, chloroplastic-like [Elaeis guineensis]
MSNAKRIQSRALKDFNFVMLAHEGRSRIALVAPAALIAHNAGVEEKWWWRRLRIASGRFGHNAMADKYENLLEAGVIDPAKVTRCALQNAASVAGMVLTTQAIVVEQLKPKAPVAEVNHLVVFPSKHYALFGLPKIRLDVSEITNIKME